MKFANFLTKTKDFLVRRIAELLGLVIIFLSFALYKLSVFFNTTTVINTIYLVVFVLIVVVLEKSKKEVISEPKLFD